MSWHTRHLELDWLRALVTIVDCGGFSAAAEQLGRSQSAISLQIKRLEDTVGQPVLRRSQGRVDGPTSEGRVLLDYARRMLRLNDEAWACFAQPQMAGRLRLGLPEELMEQVFAPVQAAFARLYPRVNLSVRCDLSVRLAALAQASSFSRNMRRA
jgi:DNA-binding transcriptional LysR family regulator